MTWANARRAALWVAALAVATGVLGPSATGAAPDVSYGVSAAKGCDSPTLVGQKPSCFFVFTNVIVPGVGKVVSNDTVEIVSAEDIVSSAAGPIGSGNLLPKLTLVFTPSPGSPGAPSCTGGTGSGTAADPYTGATRCRLPWGGTISSLRAGWYTARGADFNLPEHKLGDQISFSWVDLCDRTPDPATCDPQALNLVQAPAVTTLRQPAPALQTTASPAQQAPASLTDTATLFGTSTDATGTITFHLYSDYVCVNEVATGTATVHGPGDYVSPAVAADSPGTYFWRAQYSGDANNAPVALTPCGDPNERTEVVAFRPSIFTVIVPSSPLTVGVTVHDTAGLAGAAADAGGMVTYRVFADAACMAQASGMAPSTVIVRDGVVPPSADYVFASAGTFYFVATYSGDAHNDPASSGCYSEPLIVEAPQPLLVTAASPALATAPAALVDTASLVGATVTATGTITFHLYSDTTCSGEVAGSPLSVPVHGTGPYTSSPAIRVKTAGTYSWRASYSGDANNNPVPLTACGAAGESTTVAAPARLSICESADNGAGREQFTFTGTNLTTGESLAPITVRGGQCSPAIDVNAGRWKIFEDLGSGLWTVTGASVQPPLDGLAENDAAGWVKVKVIQSQETQVTFTSERAAAALKVCKYSSSPAYQGTTYAFAVGKKTLTAVAGPTKSTAGCSAALPEPLGTMLKVSEVVPPGQQVARITVSPNTTLASRTAGVARVVVGAGMNVVYYDDEPLPPG